MNKFIKAYQDMFDSFVFDRKLDFNDDYWSDQDKEDFRSMYEELLKAHNRKPL